QLGVGFPLESDIENSLKTESGFEFNHGGISRVMTLESKSEPRVSTEERYDSRTEMFVDGTVMRITGAGRFVVYPVNGHYDVKVGNPVRIVVATATRPYVSLEAREEPISTPISS